MKRKSLAGVFLCFAVLILLILPVYAASEPAEWILEVENSLTGDRPSTAESFTFVLEPVDGAPMPEQDMITITGEGRASFPAVTYTEPEDYHYTLREVKGSTQGYIYDETVYNITVQVIMDDEGGLAAVVYISEEGSDLKAEKALFSNKYVSLLPDNQKGDTGKTPQTGDGASPALWLILCGGSLIGLIGLSLYSRKKTN